MIVSVNTRKHTILIVVAFTLLVSFNSFNSAFVLNGLSPYQPMRPSSLRYIDRVFTPFVAAATTTSPDDSVTGITTTIMNNQDRGLARQYIQEGMKAFRIGDVSKSIEYFNLAEQNDRAITPYLWQRGLSYYYNDQYDKASQQFRIDVSVNPYDVEEIVWDIASQLRSSYYYNKNNNLPVEQQQKSQQQASFPIAGQLSLPPGSNDRRRIMGYVYKLFRGEGTEHDLALAGSSKDASLSDEFYALFYLALFNESFNRQSAAELYLRQALETKYGQQSNDYMVSCAKVQLKLRK